MESLRRSAGIAVFVVFAVIATACTGFADPEGWASPVVDDDTALIFQKHERVSLVQLEDGRIVRTYWAFPNDGIEEQKDIDLRAVYRAPESDGEFYYMAGFSGVVAAVNLDGSLEWSCEVDGNVVTGVVLSGDSLYLGTSNGELIRLPVDQPLGREKCQHSVLAKVDDEVWTPPVVIGDRVFAGSMNGTLYGFDAENGDQLWSIEGSGAIPDLQAVDDSLLFVPSLDGTVRFIDIDGEQFGTTFEADDWVWSHAATRGGVAYFGDFAGSFYALDISTGTVQWEYDAEGKVKASPVIVGDKLVIVTEDAVVHFLELEGGGFLNKVPLQDAGTIRATPTVVGSGAYIIGTKGRLFFAEPDAFTVREVPRPES